MNISWIVLCTPLRFMVYNLINDIILFWFWVCTFLDKLLVIDIKFFKPENDMNQNEISLTRLLVTDMLINSDTRESLQLNSYTFFLHMNYELTFSINCDRLYKLYLHFGMQWPNTNIWSEQKMKNKGWNNKINFCPVS